MREVQLIQAAHERQIRRLRRWPRWAKADGAADESWS